MEDIVQYGNRKRLMGRIVTGSIMWGAVFGGIMALATALGLWCYWGAQGGGQPGVTLAALIFWVPSMAFIGGVVATVLFGVVGVIMALRPLGLEPSPISYAVLGSLLAYGLFILWEAGGLNGLHALWVGGGLHAVLHGPQGRNDVFVPILLLPTVITGLLIGWKVRAQQ